MKYHLLDRNVCCPFCGRANLAYKRPGQHGDVYGCNACLKTVVHRRQKGKPACGLVPVLNFGQLGYWKPCATRYWLPWPPSIIQPIANF